jgi:hypothetical protein
MFRRKRPMSPADDILTWAMQHEGYGGPFRPQYRAGLNLLKEGYRDYQRAQARSSEFRRLATVLSVVTTILAAAAGITVLPAAISRWVTAGIAFAAAVVSGLATAFRPEQAANRAGRRALRWEELRDEVDQFLRWLSILSDTPANLRKVEDRLLRLQRRRSAILVAGLDEAPTIQGLLEKVEFEDEVRTELEHGDHGGAADIADPGRH